MVNFRLDEFYIDPFWILIAKIFQKIIYNYIVKWNVKKLKIGNYFLYYILFYRDIKINSMIIYSWIEKILVFKYKYKDITFFIETEQSYEF